MGSIITLHDPGEFDFTGSSCAIGVFDGVHLGHQHLLNCVKAAARRDGRKSIVITFDIDPDELFDPDGLMKLQSNESRLATIADTGVDYVVALPFEGVVQDMEPIEFLDTVFQKGAPAFIHVGEGFTFGKANSGTTSDLRRWGQAQNVAVSVHTLVKFDGEVVSSTRIRNVIDSNRDVARLLLGRTLPIMDSIRYSHGANYYRSPLQILTEENEHLRDSLANIFMILDAVKALAENGTSSQRSLDDVLEHSVRIFELGEAGIITMYDPERDYDEVVATYNHDKEHFVHMHMRAGQGATGWTYQTGTSRIWNGVEGVYSCLGEVDPKTQQEILIETGAGHLRSSLMCVPIYVRGRIVGAIQIEHYSDERQFTETDLALLEALVATSLSMTFNAFDLNEQISEQNREIRRLLRRTITSQEEERKRVARDLHDDVAQTLAGLRIAISNLERFAARHEGGEEIVDYLRELDEEVSATIETTRRLTSDLRPGLLNDNGLVSGLNLYMKERVAAAGIETHMAVEEGFDENILEEWTTVTLFRVSQEALSNVVRHSGARNVYVSLSSNETEGILDIVDDGCGFNPSEKRESTGIKGMEERLSMIGGSIQIFSSAGEGTAIRVTVNKERGGND